MRIRSVMCVKPADMVIVDDILITKECYENLTTEPKSLAEVEMIMNR